MPPADAVSAQNLLRSPTSSALLSALLPGLGHLHTRPALGRILLGFSLGAAGGSLVWLATSDRADVLAWTVEPDRLLGVILLCAAMVVIRWVVAIDAARAAGLGRTRRRLLSQIGLIVVLILVAVPHVVVATLAWQQRNMVTKVFTAEQTATARPTRVAGIAVTRSESELRSESVPEIRSEHVDDIDEPAGPARTDTERGAGTAAETDRDTSPSTTRPRPAEETPPPPDPPKTWDGDDRLSIVMLGSDGGYDRKGIRTDTIIVLSIDIATGDAATFSVPRNWTNLPFPDGTAAARAYPSGNPDLANTFYGLGQRRPELFPDADHPGGAAVKAAMAQTLGIPIHYFVMVDMTAVVETIDLFGGIDLTVTERINDRIRPIEKGGPYLDINVGPGDHHFDGLTTLAYVRSRVQSWDYSRMARQRCVVAALIDQVTPLDVVAKFGPFTGIVSDHVVTDIPLDRADELLAIAARLDTERMRSVNFVPPEFPSGRVPLNKVRSAVETTLSTDVAPDPDRSMTTVCGSE